MLLISQIYQVETKIQTLCGLILTSKELRTIFFKYIQLRQYGQTNIKQYFYSKLIIIIFNKSLYEGYVPSAKNSGKSDVTAFF